MKSLISAWKTTYGAMKSKADEKKRRKCEAKHICEIFVDAGGQLLCNTLCQFRTKKSWRKKLSNYANQNWLWKENNKRTRNRRWSEKRLADVVLAFWADDPSGCIDETFGQNKRGSIRTRCVTASDYGTTDSPLASARETTVLLAKLSVGTDNWIESPLAVQ